jgi:hypothetical protein
VKRVRVWGPLVVFVVQALAIGYGVVLPRNSVGPWSELGLGFLMTLVGASVSYVVGVREAGKR